jgi:hypothetical protein
VAVALPLRVGVQGRPETCDLYWDESHDPAHLVAVLPSCELWDIDGPSSNGPGWSRSGEPPAVTVSPSILTPRYHGFLRNGVFTPDIDKGRTYPHKPLGSGLGPNLS